MSKKKNNGSDESKNATEDIKWPKKPPKIQVTTDYDQFNLDKTNRPIDRNKVERFKQAMRRNPHIFRHNPCWIGKDNYIIDGQHRFTAAKELGGPIYYTKDDSSSTVMAGEVNKNNDAWSIKEWIHHYNKRGVSTYEKVVQYGEWYMNNLEGSTYAPPWKALAALLSRGTTEPGGEFKQEIKDGLLTDDNEDYLKTMFEELKEMQELAGAKFLRTSSVLSAYNAVKKAGNKKYYDDFDYDVFIKQLERTPDSFTSQRHKADYRRMFEDIYNYRKQKKARFC